MNTINEKNWKLIMMAVDNMQLYTLQTLFSSFDILNQNPTTQKWCLVNVNNSQVSKDLFTFNYPIRFFLCTVQAHSQSNQWHLKCMVSFQSWSSFSPRSL